MARASIGSTVVAESSGVINVEGNKYFPPSDVKKELLTVGTRQYTCPWKGKATYWDINIGDKVYRNSAWSYETPKDAAKNIMGYVAFELSAVTVTG
jgi:uncharacterized protein (DUF427 family)